MNWSQVYDPLGNQVLSTLVAGLPIVVLLGVLALFHIEAHWAAILGLIVALAVAVFVYGHEGDILRDVFFHSLALAALMGVLVMAQAYVYPFTAPVLR